MNGKTIIFLGFLMGLAAGCTTGFARVGEVPATMAQRYGPPVSTAVFTGFTRIRYEKQGFMISVFYQNGQSVLEIFAKRGLSQPEADKLVTLVATRPADYPDPTLVDQIRRESNIICHDSVFWTWKNAFHPMTAAFNPIECTVSFFSEPRIYARVQHALQSSPLAGS